MAPVFHPFAQYEVASASLATRCLCQITSLAAALWARFRCVESWPLALVGMVDPGLPEEALRQVAHNFWLSEQCCSNTEFGAKVKPLFPAAECMFTDRFGGIPCDCARRSTRSET